MGALKKPDCNSVVKPKNKIADATDNTIQKAEIDRMKRLITDKIKDPELARKAAMIISEMLDKQIK
jgi:histone H3/H4